jgi:predicted metal-binding protein
MDYRTKVYVKKTETDSWLRDYCFPEKFCDLCSACPDYGRVWSCPPDTPGKKSLEGYTETYIIAVKVIYGGDDRRNATTSENTEKIRRESYGRVKKVLLEVLLALEKELPDSLVLAPGRCEQCETCTRAAGLPCVKPERRRYSLTSFGFDFTKLAKEYFGLDLVWSSTGLPEYNLAIAAILTGRQLKSRD